MVSKLTASDVECRVCYAVDAKNEELSEKSAWSRKGWHVEIVSADG